MIFKEELKNYAKITGLNLGQAEKDYFQTVILFILFQFHGKDLIFKGGTALKKCYGLERFSEDLDFTCTRKIAVKELQKALKRFKLEFVMETKDYDDGLKIILRIKGPLYTGQSQSLCRFIIDFSLREKVMLRPETKTLGRFLEEFPAFDVLVMQEKEILAEKIRAILSRNKARDVYDLWFLLKKNVDVDKKLIAEKFKYYSQVWDAEAFEKNIENKKNIWATELRPLVGNLPDFGEVKKVILHEAKKWKL